MNRKSFRNVAIIVTIAIAGVPLATAQETRPVLNAASAQAIIDGCKAFGADNDLSQAIAVTDAGGNLVAFLRLDGNGAGVGAFAIEKAIAVGMWGFATAGMAEGANSFPGFAMAPGVVTVPGGVPIYSADGKTFLGGAAASGEPPEDDVACVEAGIKAAGLTHIRVR